MLVYALNKYIHIYSYILYIYKYIYSSRKTADILEAIVR